MLWSAFLLGLVGSLHCVGMCAPIALALPYDRQQQQTMLFQTLRYNLGRALMYAFQGCMFGFLGKGLAWAGLQQSLSISLGVVFIAIALWSFGYKKAFFSLSFFTSAMRRVRQLFSKVLQKGVSHFWLGVVNGLLPCGLVYWALATSVLMLSPLYSAAYMFLFGVGTMPLMIAAVVGSRFMNRRIVSKFYQLLPVYQVVLGLFLIWRGFAIDAAAFWQLHVLPMCH